MTPSADVVVSLLTPAGRGALAVVGIAGPGAAEVVASRATFRGPALQDRPDGAICLGHWASAGGAVEELVVVRHSGERIEVHAHGGSAAPAAVLESLVAAGCRPITWQQWLAATAAPAGVADAMALASRVMGPRAARIVIRQAAGAFAAERERIEGLLAAGDRSAARDACDRLRRAARIGLRLDRPWRVVLAGDVNAGKSSLVNALAGHARSLVAPTPGTTRDLVEVRLVLSGWEVVVIDTAGVRSDPVGATERAGIDRAVAARAAADLVVDVHDATAQPRPPLPGALAVASKCDLLQAGGSPPDRLGTSAVAGAGIAQLAAAIVARLVPEEQLEPGLLDGPVPLTRVLLETLPA